MGLAEFSQLPKIETKEFNGQAYTIEHFFAGDLNAEEKLRLANELTPLTGKGFLRFDLYSTDLEEDVTDHVVEAPRLTILRNFTGEAVAFIAGGTFQSKEGINFYDLGGIIVDPSLHGTHISSDSRISIAEYLLTQELISTAAEAIVLRTQNQKMLNLAAKVAELDRLLAAQVATEAGYYQNLDGDINHRAYRKGNGTCLYDDIEAFSRDAIQMDGLDWLHGDALVVAGFVKINQDSNSNPS